MGRRIDFKQFDMKKNSDSYMAFDRQYGSNTLILSNTRNIPGIDLSYNLKTELKFHQPITKAEDILALGLDEEKTAFLMSKLPDVIKDIEAGYVPKVSIDFETGDVFTEYFPMALALEELGIRQGPTGVSCSIVTSDGYVLVIKRSIKNTMCKQFLGTVAGYVRAPSSTGVYYNTSCFASLIKKEIYDQIDHEIGLSHRDVSDVEIFGYVETDYPIKQKEIVARIITHLTRDEVNKGIVRNSIVGLGELAEKDCFWLTQKQLLGVLTDSEVHGATGHLYAMSLALTNWCSTIEDESDYQALLPSERTWAQRAIAKLRKHNPKQPWNGFDKFMKKHGIYRS